ncbi:unnamed protein product, partial [marine sediment metagenome]
GKRGKLPPEWKFNRRRLPMGGVRMSERFLVLIIAGVILVACTVLVALDFNSYLQSIGFLAAGTLFGVHIRR